MSKKQMVGVGIVNFIRFLLVHFVWNLIALFLIDRSHIGSLYNDSNWFMVYLIVMPLYFSFGFIVGLATFKYTGKVMTEKVPLIISFVLGAIFLFGLYLHCNSFAWGAVQSLYLFINVQHAFIYDPIGIKAIMFPIMQPFFFVLGIFVQNLVFSKIINIKKKPQIIYNED